MTPQPREMPAETAAPEPHTAPHGGTAPKPAHRWGIGAFLLVEAVLLLSAAFVGAILAPRGESVDGMTAVLVVVLGSVLPPVIAAAVALGITVVRGNGPKVDLRWSMRWDDVKIGLKFGLLGLLCTTVAAVIWTKIVGRENASSAISTLVDRHPLPLTAAIVMFLHVWLLGPVCEEIIFRGLLWGALERLQWGRWAVFVLCTVVFAVSHLEPLRTTLLLVVGIPIGLARLFSGRLGPSVVAHQVNNFLPALTVLLVPLGLLPL